MHDGNIVVNVKTVNQRGEKVLDGTAEVLQPDTVYIFTGHHKSRACAWTCATLPLLPAPSGMLVKAVHFGGV